MLGFIFERGNQSRSSSPDPPYSDPLQFRVESKTDNKTVEIRRSYRVFVEGNNISQGFRKQSGGKAYGIHFSSHATRCYAFNNKLERLRHAIVFQQGANHCVAAYNHTQSNILLHGNYADNNLIEGNVGHVRQLPT